MIDERFPQWLVDIEKGTIYSLKHKRYIGSIDKNGYVLIKPPKGYRHKGLHQYIWMVANRCDIPEGYDIHHIDCNPSNNSIYNLELIEHKKHRSEHKIGKHHTDETKRKISEANKGVNHPFYGKHHTEEHRRKISEANVNNPKLSKQVAQYTLDGELVKIWLSACECGRNGFNKGNVSECCNGKKKTHKGYIWNFL